MFGPIYNWDWLYCYTLAIQPRVILRTDDAFGNDHANIYPNTRLHTELYYSKSRIIPNDVIQKVDEPTDWIIPNDVIQKVDEPTDWIIPNDVMQKVDEPTDWIIPNDVIQKVDEPTDWITPNDVMQKVDEPTDWIIPNDVIQKVDEPTDWIIPNDVMQKVDEPTDWIIPNDVIQKVDEPTDWIIPNDVIQKVDEPTDWITPNDVMQKVDEPTDWVIPNDVIQKVDEPTDWITQNDVMQKVDEPTDWIIPNDVIQKVDEPTDWVSSIAIVEKPDGSLRICLDPRDLNQNLKQEHYQLPAFEEISMRMSEATLFTKLDVNKGYWQIPLDYESSLLTTMNTPFGRYRFNRMPFGIHSAQEVFHKRVQQLFGDLPNVETDIDDLLIWGTNQTNHGEPWPTINIRPDIMHFRRLVFSYTE